MIDIRSALPEGSMLSFENGTYTIINVLAHGGSCIVYLTERNLSEYERNAGMPTMKAVIKEFYPFQLADFIERVGFEIKPYNSVQADFAILKELFENGVARQMSWFTDDTNHALPAARPSVAHNNIYSVVDLAQGSTLELNQENLSICEISEILISLANAVKTLHDKGELHLDIKPENIWLFEKVQNESRRVSLFDLDTTVKMNEIATAIIPVSEDWSPIELTVPYRERISYATDIYLIGAVFYWLISGHGYVTDKILRKSKFDDLDFIDEFPAFMNKISPRITSKEILRATLRREVTERVQNIANLLES